MRRYPVYLVLLLLGAAFLPAPRAGAGGESAIHPENRPQGVEGETNGQMRPGSLVTVEGQCRVARAAGPSLALMLAAARSDGVGLLPRDCYRPSRNQGSAHARACAGGNCACAAPAGTSMHGWGKAVDFRDQRGTVRFTSAGYRWLSDHGARFGWNHPRWAKPGNPCPEAWHWEWVGDGGRMNLAPIRADVVDVLASPTGRGYRVITGLGAVAARGDSSDDGSALAVPITHLIRAGAATASGAGYWMVAADGGIFTFGDAPFLGSLGDRPLNRSITGMAATASGAGYWLVAADGGIFTFGDAPFRGSLGHLRLNQPIVAMAATPTGAGYWLVAADGGVFAFGDAVFAGSLGAAPPGQPVVAIEPTPTGHGYWMATSDGRVFPFGDATAHGDLGEMPPNQPVVGMAADPAGGGYWLVAADGGVFAFGNARFFGTG